jgi:hypothetical protein
MLYLRTRRPDLLMLTLYRLLSNSMSVSFDFVVMLIQRPFFEGARTRPYLPGLTGISGSHHTAQVSLSILERRRHLQEHVVQNQNPVGARTWRGELLRLTLGESADRRGCAGTRIVPVRCDRLTG